jgi:mannose-6-phosphate isomerase-like protein (cupin superfamily)
MLIPLGPARKIEEAAVERGFAGLPARHWIGVALMLGTLLGVANSQENRITVTDLDTLLRQHPLPPGTHSDVAAEWPTGNGKLQVVVESRIPPHIHDDTDHALFIARGTGVAYLAGETRRIKPGDIIFIPHGISHGFEKDSSSEDIVMLVVETPSQ